MIQIVMPQMGESLAEGTIVRWLKEPGERVERDEPVVEISTDKVDTDVPAPVSGILWKILVQAGETVEVGRPMGLIEPEGGEEVGPPPTAAGVPPAAPATDEGARSDTGAGHFSDSRAPQTIRLRSRSGSAPSIVPPPTGSGAGQAQSRIPATGPAAQSKAGVFSPAVLDVATRERIGLDELTRIRGTGRGGRITKRDVECFLAARRSDCVAAVPSAGRSHREGPLETEVPPEYIYRPAREDRRVPMSPVRRKIARHMAWSTRISPHATAFADCDMQAASAAIAAAKAVPDAWRRGPLTFTVLAARAAILALAEFEVLNASVVGDEIVYRAHVNLGIAVALPDTHDLVVPVVGHAEELSLQGLAGAIHDLATRARSRTLRLEELQGGSFTLTNPGIFGGTTGTPILNQPQVAILGLGAVVKKPVVIDDAIAIRPMMTMALTFDHRAADGMVAFSFLDRVRQLLGSADTWR